MQVEKIHDCQYWITMIPQEQQSLEFIISNLQDDSLSSVSALINRQLDYLSGNFFLTVKEPEPDGH